MMKDHLTLLKDVRGCMHVAEKPVKLRRQCWILKQTKAKSVALIAADGANMKL